MPKDHEQTLEHLAEALMLIAELDLRRYLAATSQERSADRTELIERVQRVTRKFWDPVE